jgi:GntR family transcriptional regulator / MocR family aminotransferase
METHLHINLHRRTEVSLVEQIHFGIGAAIRDGRLQPGARLPSWKDLAAQLGVARGTVRAAYERLIDAQLIVSSGPAGTHVANHPPIETSEDAIRPGTPLACMFRDFSRPSATFQMGVPAQDAFPSKLWSRIMARAGRAAAAAPTTYPDPRGEPGFRRTCPFIPPAPQRL